MTTKRRFEFTTKALDELELPSKGKRNYLYDTKVSCLELVIYDSGTKVFKFYKKHRNKLYRKTIGDFEELPVKYAREAALEMHNNLLSGKNPNQTRADKLTFEEVAERFIEQHAKIYNKTWKEQERLIDKHLRCLKNRVFDSIQRHEIVEMHFNLGKINGNYTANRVLEVICSIYNRAIEWGLEVQNPAVKIRKFKEKQRERFLLPEELPRFLEALSKEENTIVRDFIYMLLFTGARKSNVMQMQWEDVSFSLCKWTIRDSKNGERLEIPLIESAIEVLERRKKENRFFGLNSNYIFPSFNGDSHFTDPKNVWKRILRKANIKNLRMHDLRRSMGSYQAILGANSFTIGKSLGHKSQAATAIYARLNLDPVRQSMNNAANHMLNYQLSSSEIQTNQF